MNAPEVTKVNRADSITVFIPTKNEIDGMRSILPQLKSAWYDELIVIDGGSTDGTVEFLREHGIDVRPEAQKGWVNAYNQAFRESTGEIFVIVQGDGNCLVDLIPLLTEKIAQGYDMVTASRYLPPAKSYDDNAVTAFGNYLFTKIINILFAAKYTDTLNSYRAYRRTAVLEMGLHVQPEENWLRKKYDLMNSWEVGGCVRAARLRLKTHDIPGDEPPRIGGRTKVRVVWNGLMIIAQILYELFYWPPYNKKRR